MDCTHFHQSSFCLNHRCKNVDPKNKNVNKRVICERDKKNAKRLNKRRYLQIKELFKLNQKFSSKITVLVSYSMHDNVWELWLFIREFPVAAMLNPSFKSRSM